MSPAAPLAIVRRTSLCALACSLALPTLNDVERAQLGTTRYLKDGSESAASYPPARLWPRIRAHLLARSRHANPLLDGELTAYTPGETLELLGHPTVRAWHRAAARFRVPDRYSAIVLVPCAKTKPWEGAAASRSTLYSAYNAIRAERPDLYFVTISEPLGIVPMDRWADFPQYDNPGLFRDDALRSGMTSAEWAASPFGRRYALPFDEAARAQSIAVLGDVVAGFLEHHGGRRIIAFVDSLDGPESTHGEMLDHAIARSGVAVERHAKRGAPRVSPLPYLRDVLGVPERRGLEVA